MVAPATVLVDRLVPRHRNRRLRGRIGIAQVRAVGGGESGIRTHDTVTRIPVFETGAFVRDVPSYLAARYVVHSFKAIHACDAVSSCPMLVRMSAILSANFRSWASYVGAVENEPAPGLHRIIGRYYAQTF